MATNTLLDIDMVTNEALRILHQKLNFIGSINRQYDDSFAKNGAKIGSNLRVKLPPRYTSATGATYSANNTVETFVNVPCSTQRHVGMDFTSKDLTLSIDSMAESFLEPAMAQLAADMEKDAFNMYQDIYAQVGTAGTVPNSWKALAQAAGRIRENGLVNDDSLCAILNVDAHIELADAIKTLQQPEKEVSGNYRKGMLVSSVGGFDKVFENTMIPVHTNGTMGGTPLVNGATQTGSTINMDGVTAGNTWTKGTVFTIAGVFAVHPETRVSTGKLQQFVVTSTATFTGGAAAVGIAPAITTSGQFQTVTGSPADNAAVTVVGAASIGYAQNLAFHKDAFAFVTADLVKPTGSVEFCSQKTYDGLTLRILRQYDARNDEFVTRADVLYGYATLRRELACRLTA
jgi:P22 coat protein - gene protein 5